MEPVFFAHQQQQQQQQQLQQQQHTLNICLMAAQPIRLLLDKFHKKATL